MAYSVTKHQSYGSRIGNSFIGVLVGIALIIGMSVLLFWNEGRYNPADLAVEAQEVNTLNADSLNGQLVWYKGTLTGGPMIYDSIITNANYINLTSTVEVYAWIEKSSTSSHDNVGGSQDTTTTYTYETGWTSSPQDPSSFNDQQYKNKPFAVATVSPVSYKNTNITTADFAIEDDLIIDGTKALTLDSTTVNSSALNNDILISGNYIYYKTLTSTGPATPIVGDTRVSYTYIPASLEGVLVGKMDGNSIVGFSNEDTSIYRFFDADTLEEVVEILDSEFKSSTWIIRLIGALLMCVGFAMLTGPLSTLLMVLPFLGHTSKFILGIISFLVGVVYSFVVIIISAIFHNVIALVIAIGILIILVITGISKGKKKKLQKAK